MWLLLPFVLVGVVRASELLALTLSNLAMLDFLKALPFEEELYGASGAPQHTRADVILSPIDRGSRDTLFSLALTLHPESPTARWGWARTALADGDFDAAGELLAPVAGRASHHIFLYRDALLASGRSGAHESVVSLFESMPPLQPMWIISDTVAAAYLALEGEAGVGKVGRLRPNDLYANYSRWQSALRSGDAAGAATYRQALSHYDITSVSPTDERLLTYTGETAAKLAQEGVWTRQALINVVAFFVWQHYTSSEIEGLLEALIERNPVEPEWHFYLAEMYQRRGALEPADRHYRRATELDPDFAQAYLRLGLMSETRFAQSSDEQRLVDALEWYGRYGDFFPDDFLMLERLSVVCALLDNYPPAATGCPGEAELQLPADDRAYLAERWSRAVESVVVSADLLNPGQIEGLGSAWEIADMTGGSRSPGFFVGGIDRLEIPAGSTRITGFWLDNMPDRPPGRFGFWLGRTGAIQTPDLALLPHSCYLISVVYKTENLSDGAASIWLADEQPDPSFHQEEWLPATAGSWQRYRMLRFNPTASPLPLHVLVRSWQPGRVWFYTVEIRQVNLTQEPGSGESICS